MRINNVYIFMILTKTFDGLVTTFIIYEGTCVQKVFGLIQIYGENLVLFLIMVKQNIIYKRT